MKKVCFFGATLLICLTFFGCAKVDELTLFKQNMSELTEGYFFSNDPSLNVSLTTGRREEPYIYDGKSCDKLDFSLLIADLGSGDKELVHVNINGEEVSLVMDYNFIAHKHMADLERVMKESDEIFFEFEGKKVKLECLSKDFAISCDDAIKIGMQHMEPKIQTMWEGKSFNGEAYLKIMDLLSGGSSQPYWLFSVLDQNGKMTNLIISTSHPIVLADGEQSMI